MRNYLVPPTAANARKLVDVARTSRIILSPEIYELAKTGLLAETDLPFRARLDVVQQLVDYGGNAVIRVKTAEHSQVIPDVAAALKLLGVQKVVLIHHRTSDAWEPVLGDIRLTHCFPSHFPNGKHDFDVMCDNRDGALIVDSNSEVFDTELARNYKHVIAINSISHVGLRSRSMSDFELEQAIHLVHGPTPFDGANGDRAKDERMRCIHMLNLIDLLATPKSEDKAK